jgi:hypothetical protein
LLEEEAMAEDVQGPMDRARNELEVLRSIEQRLVSAAYQGHIAVRAYGLEESQIAARKQFVKARGATEIDAAMRQRGLLRMANRARTYAPFSKVLGRPKVISIVPYSSPDPNAKVVGAVGFSEGEPASGVVVELAGTKIVNFVTIDFMQGKLGIRRFAAQDLTRHGPGRLVERKVREPGPRDITIDISSSISNDALRALLVDQYSAAVHTPDQIAQFLHNAPVVSSIAELQFMRLQGLTSSPGTSCCCCCCCCWGSCSSCSAVSNTWVNPSYYSGHVA